tara:strand:- start:110 stop:589 length:480 start_codon:yes stop_codon:yes gene_type:complete
MVNASLNWASIFGLILFISAIPSAVFSVKSLNNLSSSSNEAALRIAVLIFQIIGMPLCGLIIFFQGWRLDPILQFSQAILVISIVLQQVIYLQSIQKSKLKEKSILDDLAPLEPLEDIENKNSNESNLESKLSELKLLKDKKLISEDEFNKLRKKLLAI